MSIHLFPYFAFRPERTIKFNSRQRLGNEYAFRESPCKGNLILPALSEPIVTDNIYPRLGLKYTGLSAR